MSLCRSCSAELPAGSKFCLKCGKAKNGSTSPVPVDPIGLETVAMDSPTAPVRPISSGSAPSGLERHRFEPGSLLPAAIASFPGWAKVAWVKCSVPRTSCWANLWRSNSCPNRLKAI